MSDTFDGFQGIRQPLNITGVASYSDNFQTVITIQMNMLSRNDDFLKVMLNIVDPLQERPLMVVINDGDGPGDFLIPFPFLFDQLLTDEIAKCLRTIGILSRPD